MYSLLKKLPLCLRLLFCASLLNNCNAWALLKGIPGGAIRSKEWKFKFEKQLVSLANTKENVSPIRSTILKEETIDGILAGDIPSLTLLRIYL